MRFATLPADVQEINERLKDLYGVDTDTGDAIWRVSWSDDQTEKRVTKYTDSGLELLFPEVQIKKKYPHVKERWILERLVLIPEQNQAEIPEFKKSYECMYPFENAYTGEYLPAKLEAAKFVVDTVYAALGKSSMAKYIDEEKKNPIESREKRIAALQEELFGDESSLLLRTVTGEAVAYTGPTPDILKEND